jgi:hypothetical protein
MYTNWGWAVWLGHLGDDRQDFANILPRQEVLSANPSILSPQDKARLAQAAVQTQQALAATKAALAEAEKATGVH